MDKIKQCKNLCNEDKFFLVIMKDKDTYYCICEQCGRRTNEYKTEEQAIKNWNKEQQ